LEVVQLSHPPSLWEVSQGEGEVDEMIVQFGSPSPAYGRAAERARAAEREGDLLGKTLVNKLDDLLVPVDQRLLS